MPIANNAEAGSTAANKTITTHDAEVGRVDAATAESDSIAWLGH